MTVMAAMAIIYVTTAPLLPPKLIIEMIDELMITDEVIVFRVTPSIHCQYYIMNIYCAMADNRNIWFLEISWPGNIV